MKKEEFILNFELRGWVYHQYGYNENCLINENNQVIDLTNKSLEIDGIKIFSLNNASNELFYETVLRYYGFEKIVKLKDYMDYLKSINKILMVFILLHMMEEMTREEFIKILEFNDFKQSKINSFHYTNENYGINVADADMNICRLMDKSNMFQDDIRVPRKYAKQFYDMVIEQLSLKMPPKIETLQDYVKNNFSYDRRNDTYRCNEYKIHINREQRNTITVFDKISRVMVIDTDSKKSLEQLIAIFNLAIGICNYA